MQDKLQSIHPTKTNYSKRSDQNGGIFDKLSYLKPLPKENKVIFIILFPLKKKKNKPKNEDFPIFSEEKKKNSVVSQKKFLISKENEKNENLSHFDKGAHQNLNTTLYGKKLNSIYQSKNNSIKTNF